MVRNDFVTVSLYYFVSLFLSDAYQIQKSVTIANETTVILNGDHHNHSLAPPAEPSVTTTIAVIHEEEDEEEEEKGRERASHCSIIHSDIAQCHSLFQRSDEPQQCMSRSPSMLLS